MTDRRMMDRPRFFMPFYTMQCRKIKRMEEIKMAKGHTKVPAIQGVGCFNLASAFKSGEGNNPVQPVLYR